MTYIQREIHKARLKDAKNEQRLDAETWLMAIVFLVVLLLAAGVALI